MSKIRSARMNTSPDFNFEMSKEQVRSSSAQRSSGHDDADDDDGEKNTCKI